MDTGDVARPSLEQVREYHLNRLNSALRRPGLWGRETTLRLFMDTVAFIDGLDDVGQQKQDQLQTRGAFNAVGVRGAFSQLLPAYDDDGAVASVYAEIAWRHGWLKVDRALPDGDHDRLRNDTAGWCARDRRLDEVLSELGQPSVWCGGPNLRCSKTLIYASTDPLRGLICLHFASTYDWDAPQPQPESQPVLLAIRHGDGTFAGTFTFTPTGTARHAGQQLS